MANTTADVQDNYLRVLESIASAASGSGRDPREIRLIVVSKGRSLEEIRALYLLGQREFGENRPEEGSPKSRSARTLFAPDADPVVWHMIGHVQTRKARMIVADFDCVHSLDSLRLAERFCRLCSAAGRILPVLLECNVSGEESKHGFAADRIERDPKQWIAMKEVVETVLRQPALAVRGLMTMAPIMQDPEQARSCFQRLRCLRDRLACEFTDLPWSELSMGMTDDFKVAIEEGATLVRLGRAIFGEHHRNVTVPVRENTIRSEGDAGWK